jgi:nucleoid DNA-binding protein
MLENMDRAIKKDNPVKLATFGTEDTRWRQKKPI